MKFKGNTAKLILTWIQPLPVAVAALLFSLESKRIIDKAAITGHIAKYDKDFLALVDAECNEAYQKPLVTVVVQGGLSGNLFKAVKGWIDNLTPDRGYERILDMYLEGKRVALGSDFMSMNELVADADILQRVTFLLEKQSNELKKYMIDNKIRFDPNETFDGECCMVSV